MTIPNRMNCPHMGDGWCLKCVQAVGKKNSPLLLGADVEMIMKAAEARLMALTAALKLAVSAYDEIMESTLPPLVKASFSARFDGESARSQHYKIRCSLAQPQASDGCEEQEPAEFALARAAIAKAMQS